MSENQTNYRFSFGPWNISEGGDPFGPDVREPFPHEEKYALYRQLGFEGVQFHDDDVVPGIDGLSASQISAKANEVKAILENQGLTPEFVAPRLWFAPRPSMAATPRTVLPIAITHGTAPRNPSTSQTP